MRRLAIGITLSVMSVGCIETQATTTSAPPPAPQPQLTELGRAQQGWDSLTTEQKDESCRLLAEHGDVFLNRIAEEFDPVTASSLMADIYEYCKSKWEES